MSILSQNTISKKISFKGIGIHTGKKVNLSILPSSPNSGIVFKRVDLIKNNIRDNGIPALLIYKGDEKIQSFESKKWKELLQ